MSLLNLCLSLKTDTTPSKLEKANLTAWSQINPGRKMVAKIRCLPFLRGPTRFRKLRHISESRKRHWISVPSSFSFAVFDPMAKTNFGGDTLYSALMFVTPSDYRMCWISDPAWSWAVQRGEDLNALGFTFTFIGVSINCQHFTCLH